MYLSLPMMGFLLISRRRLNEKVRGRMRSWIMVLMISLIACYVISEILQLSLMMMFVSSGIIIVSILAGSMLAASMMIKLTRRFR
jgi:cobalamin biosynthesis protein CobD/CbiB